MYFGNLPISLGTARIIEFQWDGTPSVSPLPAGHYASWGRATQEKNMKHKILIAALAGLSLFAAAQSQTDKQKPKPSTTPTQVQGNKTSMDDWTQKVAKPASSGSGTKPSNVAAGDVNGDGVPDAVATKNSGHASEAAASATAGSSENQASHDAATGQTSGKRQHEPVAITKEVDKATPLAASGQASGKRQHQPVAITKEVDKSSPQ